MLSWWRWLTESGVDAAGSGWTVALIRVTVVSNLLIAAAYCSLAAMLVAINRPRGERVDGQKSRLLILGFVALLASGGLTHLCRAATYLWPVYHLQVVANVLAGAIAVSVAWYLVPIVVGRAFGMQIRDAVALAERLDAIVLRLQEQEGRIVEQSLVEDVRMKMLAQLMEEARDAGREERDAGRGGSG